MQSRLRLRWILLGTAVFALLGVGLSFWYNLGYHQGYAPDQPIPFSHKLHAGTYRVPCMYCHTGVEKSRHATVPAMNVCMNCHLIVKTESPHIQKLHQLYNEKKQPFSWVKVHDLPDHVYFPHNRHIARGVRCETCHGDVRNMEKITQQQTLSMGWCIRCHRGETAPDYLYQGSHAAVVQPGFTQGLANTVVAPQPRGPIAPVHCNTCHQ